MSYETVTYEVADHIATVTLDRPEVRNAFNPTMCDEFADVWQRVKADDDVRVVVLQANGASFSSGIDVKDRAVAATNLYNAGDPGAKLGPKQAEVWKPVVTAVHGVAAGGAFYWINESDILICSPDAEFYDPHLSIGLTTSLTAIGMVRHGIALRDALRIALLSSDERTSADRALAIGLVSEIVETSQLRARARQLATTIAAKAPAAVQGSVRAIWTSLDMNWAEARRWGLSHSALGNPVARRQIDDGLT
ncbi:MAG: enoyl-CoA hydratase/isomerase family protein [Ilumatobacteraceae bacterium]